MLKQYLLKREFFLTNNELDIKEHYDFTKVHKLGGRNWEGELMGWPMRQGSAFSLISGELSRGFRREKYEIQPHCSQKSTSWVA